MDRKYDYLTEGAIIAVVTAAAYYMAFKFESAYLQAFGVPDEFVTVSPERVAIMFGAILSGLLVVINFMNFLLIWLPKTGNIFRIVLPGIGIAVFGIFPLVFWQGWSTFIVFSLFSAFLFLIFYLPPLLGKGRYIDRFDQSISNEREFQEKTIYNRIANMIGNRNFYFLFSLLLLLPFIASMAGTSLAYRQKQFYCATFDDRSFIFLRKIGESGIFVDSIESNSKSLFVIRRLDHAQSIRIFSKKDNACKRPKSPKQVEVQLNVKS